MNLHNPIPFPDFKPSNRKHIQPRAARCTDVLVSCNVRLWVGSDQGAQQVTTSISIQLKILTTAVFSVLILGRLMGFKKLSRAPFTLRPNFALSSSIVHHNII